MSERDDPRGTDAYDSLSFDLLTWTALLHGATLLFVNWKKEAEKAIAAIDVLATGSPQGAETEVPSALAEKKQEREDDEEMNLISSRGLDTIEEECRGEPVQSVTCPQPTMI